MLGNFCLLGAIKKNIYLYAFDLFGKEMSKWPMSSKWKKHNVTYYKSKPNTITYI